MTATARWAAMTVAIASILALGLQQERSAVTLVVAVIFAAAFVIVCWSYGAFRKDTWIADEQTSARVDLLDQELDHVYGGGRR